MSRCGVTAASARRDGGLFARLVLACAVLVPVTSQPADAQNRITFHSSGYGRSTCAEYLNASKAFQPNFSIKETRPNGVFLTENAMYDQWIFGFLSARNFESAQQGNKRPDVQYGNAEAVAWIREWCGSRPGEHVLEAALNFMRDRWSKADVEFVFLIFQKDATEEDRAAFLKAYKVSIAAAPKKEGGYYKMRLETPLPVNQLPSLLESMKGQPRIIANAVAN